MNFNFKKFIINIFAAKMIFIFVAVVVTVMLPIYLVGSFFSSIFGGSDNYFGIDTKKINESTKQNKSMEKYEIILNKYEYENHINIDRKSFLSCAINSNYNKNPKKCFEMVNKKTGKIDVPIDKQEKDTNIVDSIENPTEEIYYGSIEESLFDNVETISVYSVYEVVSRTQNTSNASKSGESSTTTIYLYDVRGQCNEKSPKVCEVKNPKQSVYPFAYPTDRGFKKIYGFYLDKEKISRPKLDPFAIQYGDVKAIAKAKFLKTEKGYKQEYSKNNNKIEIFYDGNFVLLQDYVFNPGEAALLNQNQTYTLSVKYNGKYINPAILFGATSVTEEGYEGKFSKDLISYGAASDNLDSIHKLNFKQPFEKPILTQLAKEGWVGNGGKTPHGAIDMVDSNGSTDLIAVVGGTVIDSGTNSACGNFIILEDNETKIRAKYCHLKAPPSLSKGNDVSIGQYVGQMGNTGISFGTHLHLQLLVPQSDGSYGWVDYIDLLKNYSMYNTYTP